MTQTYTLEDKLSGRDLYGLTCRVPEPTPEQARCSHTRWETRETKWEDWSTGEMVVEEEMVEISTKQDIPGTNNFRCTRCGYTRRY